MTISIIIISVVFMIVGMMVQATLRNKFRKYANVPIQSRLTGEEIAQNMLQDHGIYDVRITSVSGQLTDHYNPINKTVNLSQDVFYGKSVAAAAVAAHECGHAVQHATAYPMLMLRSRLVPLVQISSTLSQWVIMAGIGFMGFGGGNPTVLLIGIILFAITTLFTIVTLPVEFNASARALQWMQQQQITSSEQQASARDALKWAAMTYIVAALASIAMLLQYVLIFMNRKRD
ncbi:MAG: zinc metallopeptidase [Ferruginibacter sp.]